MKQTKEKPMTKKELMAKLKAMGKITKEQRNNIVCSLIGHSMIQEFCWGYFTCGRCGTQLGDNLAGVYDGTDVVIIGHDCKKCKANYKKLTWRDKIYVPNPFKEAK